MRVVFSPEPGVFEVRWMFLPTFIGQNLPMMKKLQDELSKKYVGQPVSDKLLDDINAYVVAWITKTFPLRGIDQYIEGLRFVVEE